MKKVKSSPHTEQPQQKPVQELPSVETVRGWVEKDLKASISFLHLLKDTPGLLDKLTNEIYENAIKGPKLD